MNTKVSCGAANAVQLKRPVFSATVLFVFSCLAVLIETGPSVAGSFPAVIDARSLDGSDGFRSQGQSGAGWSVASADVNSDGIRDLIIGAPSSKMKKGGYFILHGSGSTYVLFGRSSGFPPSIDLSTLDGTNGFRVDGASQKDATGSSVAGGDVNGDGYADVIIDVTRYARICVVFGKASGFPPALSFSDIDGSNGFCIAAKSWGFWNGNVTVADLNHDGISDIVISMPNASVPDAERRVAVVFGKKSGFPKIFQLSSLHGNNGFWIDAGKVGVSVANARDVNGDHVDDLVLGGQNKAYVVYGKKSGFPPVLDLASLDGADGFVLTGPVGLLSPVAVGSAKDLNGDGVADLILGLPDATSASGKTAAGSTYVVFGRGGGFPASFDMTTVDGTTGFRIDGTQTNGGTESWSPIARQFGDLAKVDHGFDYAASWICAGAGASPRARPGPGGAICIA